ncbi:MULTISPECIES: hypothetical protein [Burkholderiaceae]|uniref:hypothetical protein n=1 Tax=Burkholderiaceae TaxID=119060 RepID=UPI001115AC1D|nr:MULTISPECIES: hypothetical protein [Burkholderiaceae]MCG1018094.1 hypothetical protein [Mycetohabitans sp. B4]
MLQAPTGIGKTLIATEVVARFSSLDNVVWLWFAPYATLIGQAANTRSQRAKKSSSLRKYRFRMHRIAMKSSAIRVVPLPTHRQRPHKILSRKTVPDLPAPLARSASKNVTIAISVIKIYTKSLRFRSDLCVLLSSPGCRLFPASPPLSHRDSA